MASQQFCLKWNNYTNNMLSVFQSLLSTESFVDVTLACDGLSLKAHKIVLSACSPYFQSLFLEHPAKHPIVIMKDMNYKEVKAIVDFMYHGEVNVSQDQLPALLKTAETLKVKGLAEVTGADSQPSDLEAAPPQQNVIVPSAISAVQQQHGKRPDSPSMHGRRKRGRARKRSLSGSNHSDDESVPTKIKQSASPEIEELSGDASMEETITHNRQGSSTSQRHRLSSFSSKPSHSSSGAHVEEPPSADENEFELEPSKLLQQTLSTDNVPAISSAAFIKISSQSQPSSSGVSISQIGASSDSCALVPVASDSLSSSHFHGPDSPQDIKPEIISFDDSLITAGTSQSMDSMAYLDQSSLPGPSNYEDDALVQHDGQSQGSFDGRDNFLSDGLSYQSPIPTNQNQVPAHPLCSRVFMCSVCSYRTFRKDHLIQHIRTHTKERPFQCQLCGKSFAQQATLLNHRKVHAR